MGDLSDVFVEERNIEGGYSFSYRVVPVFPFLDVPFEYFECFLSTRVVTYLLCEMHGKYYSSMNSETLRVWCFRRKNGITNRPITASALVLIYTRYSFSYPPGDGYK